MHGSHRHNRHRNGHAHAHDHVHGHDHHHDHDHPHHHGYPPRPGHNDSAAHELHSHLKGGGRAEELQALAETFVEGFRKADDKTSYLRLAGVPDSLPGPDGLARRLVDVTISDGYQVATASPGFATKELVYLPFPGTMIKPRTTLTMAYVSLTGRTDIDLIDFLQRRFEAKA